MALAWMPSLTLPASGPQAWRCLALSSSSCLCWALLAMPTPRAAAQDLVGCQLVDGGLQCVPGLTASPQQQIQILQQQINRTQQLEGAVQQRIAGLQALLLQGQAVEGGLLAASAAADALASVPASAFHWYRLTPGQGRWQLIPGASGPSYAISAADVGQSILVVVALPQADGSVQRLASPATAVVISRTSLRP